jgi:hypothetical protein
VVVLNHRIGTGLGLQLVRLRPTGAGRGKIRAKPKTVSVRTRTRATEPSAVNLRAAIDVPVVGVFKINTIASPMNGTINVTQEGVVTYTSRRLFIGEEQLHFELADSVGEIIGASTVSIDVEPHPSVGIPFADGTFFSDETGFALPSA